MACRRWIARLFLVRCDELEATMLPPAAASFPAAVEADGASTTPFEEAAVRGSAEESPSEQMCPGLRCFRRRRVDAQLGPPALAGSVTVLTSPPRIFSSV